MRRSISDYGEETTAAILVVDFGDDMADLVARTLRRPSLISMVFWLLILCTSVFFFLCVHEWYFDSSGEGDIIAFLVGMLLAVIAIPLHELLHLLVYQWIGAKHATINFQLSRGICYTIADRFVVSSSELAAVLSFPFAVNLVVGMVLAIWDVGYLPSVVGFTFMHLWISSGDFALMGILYQERHRTLIAYDDLSVGKMYVLTVG